MKIAVITAQFLEEYVRYALKKLRPQCETQIFIYHDFEHVGNLYLELEEQFDGFLVSGPVPRVAILKRVGETKKPLESFGTDAQCYYEVFFKALYEQKDPGLEHGYFDIMEWVNAPQPLASYLAGGTFGKLLEHVYETTTLRSLQELSDLEHQVLQKHLTLWQEGKIQYSVTRFSSIMTQLQEAGLKVYFVYPHLELIHNALDAVMRDIDLHRIYGNQLAIIRLGVRRDGLDPEELECRLDKLEHVLSTYNQEYFAGFVIQRGGDGISVFSQCREIRRITENYQVDRLKPYLQNRCGFPVCLGYGLGFDVSHAMVNAMSANQISTDDVFAGSYLRTESNESIGPLKESSTAADTTLTPEIRATAERLKLSSLTIQRILTVISKQESDQVTSQSFATALGITVRSANRLLSTLVNYGEAELLYEKQRSVKGRPERVYRILLKKS